MSVQEKASTSTYLNTSAVGLLSEASIAAAQDFQRATRVNPIKAFFDWHDNGLPVLRKHCAALLHTAPTQLAFVPNFSFGLLAVLQALKPTRKRVLLYRSDYPSLTMPFELGGFDVRYVDSSDEFSIPASLIIEAAEREKPEIIAVSHVQFLTGYLLDIVELGKYCQEKNITFIVDTTQSMGAYELHFDTLPIDLTISSSYKWLNGGFGSAVMAIKESFMKAHPPRFAGFGSLDQSPEGWKYAPSLLSYEPGHMNVSGLLQLEKGVEQRLRDGVAQVSAHNHALVKRLAQGLADTPYKVRGGNDANHLASILCFEADMDTYTYLEKHGVSVTWRKGMIRVGPHFYNTESDIDRLLELLKRR